MVSTTIDCFGLPKKTQLPKTKKKVTRSAPDAIRGQFEVNLKSMVKHSQKHMIECANRSEIPHA